VKPAPVAAARLSPVAHLPAANVDDGAIYLGPARVMFEQDYFNVPRPPAGATLVFPCVFHLRIARGKTPVAQSCD
jgi:hypothetical protein